MEVKTYWAKLKELKTIFTDRDMYAQGLLSYKATRALIKVRAWWWIVF